MYTTKSLSVISLYQALRSPLESFRLYRQTDRSTVNSQSNTLCQHLFNSLSIDGYISFASVTYTSQHFIFFAIGYNFQKLNRRGEVKDSYRKLHVGFVAGGIYRALLWHLSWSVFCSKAAPPRIFLKWCLIHHLMKRINK